MVVWEASIFSKITEYHKKPIGMWTKYNKQNILSDRKVKVKINIWK